MAQNSINYEGRVVSTGTRPIKHTRTEGGMHILEFTVAEQHSMKKGKALKDPNLKKYAEDDRNVAKGADDWINTTTSWHRLTVFGDKAEELALDEEFNHGAIIEVHEASYTEEEPWETKDGVSRAGRPETIGDNRGSVDVKFAPREYRGSIWDGESTVAKPGGSGPRKDREYADDEGF